MAEKQYNNVFWFLIDGLRPDFLHMDGTEKNFIDRLLEKGSLFNNVVTAGSGTHTSMHAIFTALLPSYNGATGWSRESLRQFRQEIFTLADYFQLEGYETFRYGDALGEKAVPLTGFKRWESSGYKIGRILKNTNLTRGERRDRFIEDVNACMVDKFVYHHMHLLHELNGELGTTWTSEQYEKNVAITAREFEKIYYEYNISDEDLVIISSDHGVILDKDYFQARVEGANRQEEQSVKSFFALIGRDIAPQCLSKPISSLDESPTVCHLVFQGNMFMPGQGNDQYEYMRNGKYQEHIFYRESGTWGAAHEMWSSSESDLFYLRDGKWKYVYGTRDSQCEWLMNLEENRDYEVNLKDQYPELTSRYHQMLEDKFNGAKSFCYESSLGFHKRDIPKMFSLLVQIDHLEPKTIESLLDMSGPYYEIVVRESEETLKFQKQYKMRYVKDFEPESLRDVCQGEWLVYITENGEWSEYFLSDLYRYMQYHRNRNVKIRGEHYTAIRKEEADNFAGIELYEEKQVRDIRYLHKGNVEKKFILFGCGDIGKEAVDYLGRANVAYFVDNNAGMVGRKVCGKTVLSFEKVQEIYQGYTLMITTKAVFVQEISRQLEENGIYDYWKFEEYERSNPESLWESGYQVVKSCGH